MKHLLIAGVAVLALLTSGQQACAWKKFSVGIGAHAGYEASGNSFLGGLWRQGDHPGAAGQGYGYNGYGPGYGYPAQQGGPMPYFPAPAQQGAPMPQFPAPAEPVPVPPAPAPNSQGNAGQMPIRSATFWVPAN